MSKSVKFKKQIENEENEGSDEDGEDDDNFCPVNKANEYKGVFYNDNSEHKYYENGAHFQYYDLCKRLNYLKKSRNEEEGNQSYEEGEVIESKLDIKVLN